MLETIGIKETGSAVYVIYGIKGDAASAVVCSSTKGFLGLATELHDIYTMYKYDGFIPQKVIAHVVPEDVKLRLQKYDEVVAALLADGINVLSTVRKRFNMSYVVLFRSYKGVNCYMVQERSEKYKGEIRGLFPTKSHADEFIAYIVGLNSNTIRPLYAYNELTQKWVEEMNSLRIHSKTMFVDKGEGQLKHHVGSARAIVLSRVKEMLLAHRLAHTS